MSASAFSRVRGHHEPRVRRLMSHCEMLVRRVSLLAVACLAAFGIVWADEKFPPELVSFRAYENNPVFAAGAAGQWDVRIRERGWIFREGDLWRMWYTGYNGAASGPRMLGYATSRDGLSWQRHAANPLYQEHWVEDMQVVREGDRYYMFAEGRDDQAQLLTSRDGVQWKREGQLDVRRTDGRPIERGPYGTPTVWRENGVWNLFYERRDQGVWLARSRDLQVWTNVSDEPVLPRGPGAYDSQMIALNQIIRHNGRYYAYYHGSGDAAPPRRWTTSVATSTDLVHWEKYAHNPLTTPEENKSSGIILHDGRQFRLYTMHDAVHAHFAEVDQQHVFVSGQEGYHTYRIPSLIVSKQGVVLAFCEGRKSGRGDAGNIDLLLKRSFDGGQTWEKTQVVWDDGENTCGNPCPVVDQRTGTIWLLLTHNLGSDTEAQIVDGASQGTRTVWVTHSRDEGATWTKPVEITKDVKRADWTWYATGPGVGIQLRNGRLLVPCDNKVAGTKARQSHVIYSDDGGQTWQLGGVVGPNCNESQVVELSDGRLLLNMRSYQGNQRRVVASSSDRGATWTAPVEDPALIEPVCQASILRDDRNGRLLLLFSNPASTKREKLTVRASDDEGKTWRYARELHAGPAAYSCLTVLPDGAIGCLYERGTQSPYETLTLARFSQKWLLAGAGK